MGYCKSTYFSPIFTLFLINQRHINDGITIIVVITKNVPQSPFNQSTNAPDEEARVVLPAVPIEANNALGFKADLRDYGVGAQILKDLGAKELIVMTNNPKKLIGLEGHDLKIADRLPVKIKPSEHNEKYLSIKKTKLNHMLD